VCGIFGYISKNDQLPSAAELDIALNEQFHRGPDMSGSWRNSSVYLGMRRLSIIDLNTGAQPIIKGNNDYVLVFNGEIYNYKKLKVELEALGAEFTTESDSEVLLNSYIHWDLDFLDKLDGMFAFAIYDKIKDSIIIARDRLGEKPLSIYEDDNKWIISSEMSSVRKIQNVNLTLNYDSLQHYLGYGYVPPHTSSYNEVRKLHPGYFAVISKGNYTEHRYHTISNFDLIKDEAKALELTNAAIERSVEAQMVADVPVGLFFSGGIDSSLILSKMVKHNPDVQAFTIGLKNNSEDESSQASEIAQYLGVKNRIHWYSEKDMISSHQKICQSYDDFFTNASGFALNMLSEIASREVKVVLCGDGGDELFGGYSRYSKVAKFKKISYLNSLAPKGSGKILRLKNKYLRNLGSDTYTSIYQKTFEIMSPDLVSRLLNLNEYNDFRYDYFDKYSKEYRLNGGTSELNELAYIDIYSRLSMSFLTKTDKMTMAHSIESRVPLLSRELIELGLRIDDSLKIKDGHSKYLLRKVLEKHLPSEMVNRKKQGFYVPVEDYFSSQFLNYTLQIINDDFIRANPVLKRTAVDEIVNQVKLGSRKKARQLWHIVNFETWRIQNQVKG
jgi:asparagine synthase (glutamine-hydrolysing)